MRILLVDHQDSFVYNLAQALEALGATVTTVRSQVPLSRIRKVDPDAIVLSPGPGHPLDRATLGVTYPVLRTLSREVPTLGVCLGHQAIGAAFGARIVRAPAPCHGETAEIEHGGEGLYEGLPSPFVAARYHSLIVDRSSLPPELEIVSQEAGGIVMGLRHRRWPIEGVQFHPESYLTPKGPRLLANFLRRARR